VFISATIERKALALTCHSHLRLAWAYQLSLSLPPSTYPVPVLDVSLVLAARRQLLLAGRCCAGSCNVTLDPLNL